MISYSVSFLNAARFARGRGFMDFAVDICVSLLLFRRVPPKNQKCPSTHQMCALLTHFWGADLHFWVILGNILKKNIKIWFSTVFPS